VKKRSKVVSVAGAFLAIAVIAWGATPRPRISVGRALDVPLRDLSPAFVDVQSLVPEKKSEGERWRGHLELLIDDALRAAAVTVVFRETKGKTVVQCRYRYGWSLPYTGRHFDSVFWTSVSSVSLKVIDRENGTVLGEAEFRRPLLAHRPSNDLIDRMLGEMARPSDAKNPTGP
jgi:hypothetical protein